jgi:hypothetical protein
MRELQIRLFHGASPCLVRHNFRTRTVKDRQPLFYGHEVSIGKQSEFERTVRENTIDMYGIVVAGFAGNSVNIRHGCDISRDDRFANIQRIDAELLFLAGDQVYDHRQHDKMWLKFGHDFGESIKDRPTASNQVDRLEVVF